MNPTSKPPQSNAVNDDATGLPGLSTWPGVYLFVFGVFIVWVALLTTLSMMFS
jgi:hypothetical protein